MFRKAFVFALGFMAVGSARPIGKSAETLASRVEAIMARPEFRHSIFGIEFYSLDSKKPIYAHMADTFFVPASTTKLVTTGSALELLGAEYRSRTRVYRTGEIDTDGTLNGDLILVASGDPNLSGRVSTDGNSLAFEDVDHSYGGPDSRGLPGDPLLVIRDLARQIEARHIKRIAGRVTIDVSLFPEGERELGTGVVISPVVVNDNVVDILIKPGAADGAAAALQIRPATSYVRFVNQVTTGKAGSSPDVRWASDVAHGDGSRTVTIAGSVPAGASGGMFAYAVPEPSRFAGTVLVEALHERGIVASQGPKEDAPDFKALATHYTADKMVAEHVSPPMAEEAKVILKVSQNLHASAMPFVLGSVLAHKQSEQAQAGFDLMNGFLTKAGLDLSGASQGDGAGGAAHFTPRFMVSYLTYMTTQKTYTAFHDALPILGKDGTLFNIQVKAPAAGHVFAKTGTFGEEDRLNKGVMVDGKGLAGYMTTADGRHLVFALYANNVRVADSDSVRTVVGEALGEIANAAYVSTR